MITLPFSVDSLIFHGFYFFVNTANDAPTAPAPLAPADGSETMSQVTLTAANATDPDLDPLVYLFELDTTASFDSPGLVSSGGIPGGLETTSWDVLVALSENGDYFWRVKASDGQAEGPWSAVFTFLVNEINEPPTTPVVSDPSDGGEVIVFYPELAVHNASDPDRDILAYDFEVWADEGMTIPVTAAAGVTEGEGITSWTVDVPLSENTPYWWRCRAHDGELSSAWAAATFFVNTANDAPTAPVPVSPVDGGSVDILAPGLVVENAIDPDSDLLTYGFEVYGDPGMTALVGSVTGLAEGVGQTSWVVSPELEDDHDYFWRARAHDGERYGPWTGTSTFTVHLPVTSIPATVNFDPDTLNLGSRGKWVTVYIELPSGYDAWSIDPATVLLQGMIPAQARPVGYGDCDGDGIRDVMVKFSRAEVEAILPVGDRVVVEVTGMAGEYEFEGIDIIRVIEP